MSHSYYIIHKPCGMLSQFSAEGGHAGLGELAAFPPDVYPVGRLDHDSEGLLLLTNDKKVNNLLLDPKKKHRRTYWVQVEGNVTDEALEQLRKGITISIDGKAYLTLPATAKRMDAPSLPERVPPIRFRKNIPTSWIELSLHEGKNRQVRRMTAATGFPTLRLIRAAMEQLQLGDLKSGDVLELDARQVYKLLRLQE